MKPFRLSLLVLSLLIALPAVAAETPVPPEAGVAAPGPGLVFVLKGGSKLVQWGETLNLSETDAFQQSGGMCAFNMGYYLQSYSGANDITNTLTDGDRLAAKQTHVTLAAGGKQYIQTQPYLVPGMNKLSLLVNAEGGNTDAKVAYVNLSGTCGKTDSTTGSTGTTPTGSTTNTTPPTTTPSTSGDNKTGTTTQPTGTTPSTTTGGTTTSGNCLGTIGANLDLKAPCLQYSGPFGNETFWVELERVNSPGSTEILYRLKNYGLVK